MWFPGPVPGVLKALFDKLHEKDELASALFEDLQQIRVATLDNPESIVPGEFVYRDCCFFQRPPPRRLSRPPGKRVQVQVRHLQLLRKPGG